MSDLFDAIKAMLYTVQHSTPFVDGGEPYSIVGFVQGSPKAAASGSPTTMKVPTIAMYEPGGGTNQRQGLGTVDVWHRPVVRVDVLSYDYTSARRILQKALEALQADFNCEGDGVVGTVTNGYVREEVGLKDMMVGEFQPADWDIGVERVFSDISILFGD